MLALKRRGRFGLLFIDGHADFYQPAIDAFRYKGDLWCIPQNVSSLAVYYNKALFDAALPLEQLMDRLHAQERSASTD